jgi:hypothetical protein
MRGAIFGQDQPRGSVPNVRAPEFGNRPVWNSGEVMQQSQVPGGHYDQAPYGQSYGAQPYGAQPYGGPQAPMGGGGSFLGTAAAAAAGMVGGSLLLGSIRSMMGGQRQGFGDTAGLGNTSATSQAPSSDQSNSSLARDAGIDDIGSSGNRADGNSRAGLFDTASNDDSDDHDDMDLDSDDFGDDGDTDSA